MGAHGLVALDWHSGNRSVLVDHELSGVVVGLTLSTRPEDVYRALLESTAFGTRRIIESFEASGVPVRELVVAGGLLKNRVPDADVRRRDPPPALVAGFRAGAGPRLGHPRGGRRGRLPRHPRRVRGHGPHASRPRTCRTSAGRGRTTRSTRSTPSCTTTSAAAPTTSCTGCARIKREAGHGMTAAAAVRQDDPGRPPGGQRAARRTGPLQPRGLDGRQRLRPGGGQRPVRHQAQRRRLRPDRAGQHDPVRPGRVGGRGRPVPVQRHRRARLRLPGDAARSAASCTPTRRTPRRGPPAASRSRAC